LGESEAITGFSPPQGSPSWYGALLKILETKQITRVDKKFLENQEPKIASGNETKLIAGLKFLGLVDKEANATQAMNNLALKGETRRENLDNVVRKAYCLLFDVVKIKLEESNANELINSFRTDYKIKSLTTAEQAAKVFVFLAQQAGIPLSKSIIEELTVSQGERKAKKEEDKQLKGKPKSDRHIEEKGKYTLIPEGMHKIEYEDTFIVFLKKGDRKTREKVARVVKQFIDTYVEEEETE
jgi:hypothetical protein